MNGLMPTSSSMPRVISRPSMMGTAKPSNWPIGAEIGDHDEADDEHRGDEPSQHCEAEETGDLSRAGLNRPRHR